MKLSMKSDRKNANFSQEIRLVFMNDHPYCFQCGKRNWEQIHHIFGGVSDSIYNASGLCIKCHSKGDVRGWENSKRLFLRTYQFISEIQTRYDFRKTEKDKEFFDQVISELHLEQEIRQIDKSILSSE